MAHSVKPADDVMTPIQREADAQNRSLAGQITHSVRVGRATQQSVAYDDARITAAMEGRLDTTELRPEEEDGWLDAFTEKMGQPARGEEASHAARHALGRGVGLNAGGNVIRAKDDADV